MKTTHLFILCVLLILCNACKKNKDDDDPSYMNEEIGKGYLTVLPIDEDDFYLFVNLGHQNPPGHVFPSGHGGFYLTDYMQTSNVYSPGNLFITQIVRLEHVTAGIQDYTLKLSSPQGRLNITFGHLSSIDSSILAKAPSFDGSECETYMAGGNDYHMCIVWTNIEVSAGDIIATGGGLPGQFGVDFGVYDKKRPVKFVHNRWADYDYGYAVSPLDYFTSEITEILTPLCGDYVCGSRNIRTIDPIGGTIEYDSTGTLQGLWYKPDHFGDSEDYHISFVFDNTQPWIPVICWGISVPGSTPGVYTFDTENSGIVNRKFVDVVPDGNIYRYEIKDECSNNPPENSMLLIQLIHSDTLKLETQQPSAGPPWNFTDSAVYFIR